MQHDEFSIHVQFFCFSLLALCVCITEIKYVRFVIGMGICHLNPFFKHSDYTCSYQIRVIILCQPWSNIGKNLCWQHLNSRVKTLEFNLISNYISVFYFCLNFTCRTKLVLYIITQLKTERNNTHFSALMLCNDTVISTWSLFSGSLMLFPMKLWS